MVAEPSQGRRVPCFSALSTNLHRFPRLNCRARGVTSAEVRRRWVRVALASSISTPSPLILVICAHPRVSISPPNFSSHRRFLLPLLFNRFFPCIPHIPWFQIP